MARMDFVIWTWFVIWTLAFGLWHLSFICHLPLCVSPPAPMARKNKWQTDETNPVYFNN